jgi:hypothetical protein
MDLQDDFPVPPQKVDLVKKPPYLLAMAGPVIVAPPGSDAFPQFTEGPPQRPTIQHDHGFLDDGNGNIDPSKYRQPTLRDYAAREWWQTKLAGAMLLRPDLADATAAYKRFLDNSGADLSINYEGFLRDDDSGKIVLNSALEDTRVAAVTIHDGKIPTPAQARTDRFSIRSGAIAVGGDTRYPYPDTENWMKTIGAHFIYIDAVVDVTVDPTAGKHCFEIKMTLHEEDMYNFNPGAKDIMTGTPDAENGRFEVTQLAHEFLTKGAANRTETFSVPIGPLADPRTPPSDLKVQRR